MLKMNVHSISVLAAHDEKSLCSKIRYLYVAWLQKAICSSTGDADASQLA